MKKIISPTLLIITVVAVFILSACNKKISSGASAASNLKYSFTGNDSYSFIQKSNVTQTVVFGGQEMSTFIDTDLGFTASGKGISNGALILDITIDTLGVGIRSMQGNMKEDISDISGKSFMMSMDQKGDNKDLDEAESLTYSVAGVQSSNMKTSFVMIFPELPAVNVEPGSTWTMKDTINISTSTDELEMIINSENTLEAKEEKFGYDCYKITYNVTGTRDGSTQTPQGLIILNADFTGSGTYYFAYNEGIVVYDKVDIKVDGDVVIPTGESIPMYMTSVDEFRIK